MTKTMTFRMSKWAKDALLIQAASNLSGVLISAAECLHEWRESGGSWNGQDCIPLKFMLFQASFLAGSGNGADYAGDYTRDDKILHEIADA